MRHEDKELLQDWWHLLVHQWHRSPVRWTGYLLLLLTGLWVTVEQFVGFVVDH